MKIIEHSYKINESPIIIEIKVNDSFHLVHNKTVVEI